MEPEYIDIKNARVHNLQSVSLRLPRNQLICFTGVSGSGKSSLAFDTLYAEGQRRYIESLSSYARQFMGQMEKPDCDLITGLSPAIAIQQKTTGWNPRSTVGTITAIHDFLRVLFARIGTQHCTNCDRPITAQTVDQIVGGILTEFGPDSPYGDKAKKDGARVLLLAPVARKQKGEFRDLFDDLRRDGYVRARVDGEIVSLRERPALQKNRRHDIEVVIDRVRVKSDIRSRLVEAIQNALGLGGGTLMVALDDAEQPAKTGATEKIYSSKYACTHCSLAFDEPTPQLFSFNSPQGMCMTCDGLGERFDFDPELLVPDPKKTFWAPCVAPMRTKIGKWRRHIYQGVADALGIDLSKPWKDVPEDGRHAILFGTGDRHVTYTWRSYGQVYKHGGTFEGVIAELREKYKKANAAFVREYYEKFMRRGPCPDCGGARINKQAAAVRLPVGKKNTGPNINEIGTMSIGEAHELLANLTLTDVQQVIAEDVLKEVRTRLEFLLNVGLHYLALDRTAPTLSGGELQRIRLAGQIGSGLVGVMYILDEPSIGLHPRDNLKLLESLERLRDMGNTVVVVEHDEDTMRAADYIVDFGPGPGVRGGAVVAEGQYDDITGASESLTGQYLSGRREIEIPVRRKVDPGTAVFKKSRRKAGTRTTTTVAKRTVARKTKTKKTTARKVKTKGRSSKKKRR